MTSPFLNAFKFTTTGEKLRGLIGLRIQQFDRLIERGKAAHTAATAELERAQNELRQNADRVLGRPAVPSGLTQQFNSPDTVTAYKREVEQMSHSLDLVQLQRTQLAWLVDQLVPTDRYEISTFDMRALGIEPNEAPPSLNNLFGRVY